MDCYYKFKRGWWCSREGGHDGPCALRPVWWNFTKAARRFRKDMKEIIK